MEIKVRTKPIPVNRVLLASAAAAAITAWLWPTAGSSPQADLLWAMFGLVAVGGLFKSANLLIEDYRLRRDLAITEFVTTDHGSAREATWDEIAKAGMDNPAAGNFLGLYQGEAPVFAPPGTPFSLIEMPPGAGKTINYVVGSILHRARLGYSVVVPDPKLELAVMTGRQLRRQGYEVWFVNPTHRFSEYCGDVEINPYQALIDSAYAEGPARKDATKFAADYAELHVPTVSGEKNPYFTQGSRRALVAGLLYQALVDPAHCTPTDVYRLLADPPRFLRALEAANETLATPLRNDPLVDFLRTEAASLIDRAKNNEENFGAFLEGATQKLTPFNPAGHLGGYGRNPVCNLAALRERQIILFVMAPLSHADAFSPFLSLLNHNIIATCKARPNGYPVHIVGEEALNYRFNNLLSDLETLRGFGVSADLYIQSFHGLVQRYGQEAAKAIEAYADVKIYAGLSALDRASHVSEMLSEMTIRKRDYSYQAVADSIGISSRELGRRLMMPNEILTLPRNKAWVFARGMNPMLLTMAHYGQVDPWAGWVDENPLEGRPLSAAPLFRIHYPE